MVLVTSRLPEGSSNFLGWVCTLATKLGKKHKHWPSTHHTVGTEGTEGYYEHSTCVLCGQSVHVFVEAEASVTSRCGNAQTSKGQPFRPSWPSSTVWNRTTLPAVAPRTGASLTAPNHGTSHLRNATQTTTKNSLQS